MNAFSDSPDKALMARVLSRPDLLPEQFISWLRRFVLDNSLIATSAPQSHGTYVPTWTAATGTDPVLNNGTLLGTYQRIDDIVFYTIELQLGSTSSQGTGPWLFGLPQALIGSPSLSFHLGSSYMANGASGTLYTGITQTNLSFGGGVIQATADTDGIGANVPDAWVSGNFVRMSGFYMLV